ncbi:class IV adenylate cyclase [Treponema phagedenis]|uniref:Class IV adenylate cyclase n=1 Tax=Treponema phagedenis TaxID=162 RepID=A0A0B7GX83_TREPH|nr:class IV adenylate cyclase [Treponema phagedenis]NVP23088.1 class IV adenylate cyclase [Treponema phagedenis]QEJ95028.1 class IV adenylate cyclase [Treponema phagedenis]QEJ98111.1 class IV adenylate cyclase [Treponema phagedenis]QKS92287.1 class IV adenylate cyclase [Treponema phagedenis]QLC57957.1 class IV adenylate cyclase [Treponema phagedenis]
MKQRQSKMQEIELKARVHDREDMRLKILHNAKFNTAYIKKDSYWCLKTQCIRIRVQESTGTPQHVFITQKEKKIEDNIEVNTELEFELFPQSLAAFTLLLQNIGFTRKLTKEKHTQSFTSKIPCVLEGKTYPLHVELSNIPPLGDFIEIEILIPQTECSPSLIEKAKQFIKHFFTQLGLSEKDIEPRPYSALLQQTEK